MFNIGGLEALIIFLVIWLVVIFAVYWVIRLAVRGGVNDALRTNREQLGPLDRG